MKSFLWKALGWVLMLIAAGGAFAFVLVQKNGVKLGWGEWLLWLFAVLLVGAFGRAAFFRGKEMTYQKILAEDTRPEILYLRSFASDARTSSLMYEKKTTTEDAELADALRDIGPLVSAAIPDRDDQPLGRREVRFEMDEWQRGVEAAIKQAPLVLVLIGTTPGLLWELERALKHVQPERFVLLVSDRRSYRMFRNEANKVLPKRLPDYSAASTLYRGVSYTIRAIIYFSSDWTPHYVVLKKPIVRTVSLKSSLKLAMKPVYLQLGLPWQPPPLTMLLRLPYLLVRPFLPARFQV